MFRPQTLGDTVFLAKQEEAKSNKHSTFQKANSSAMVTPTYSKFEPKQSYSPLTTPLSKPAFKDNKKSRSTLSSKEILERRERGQCFHCDDPYHPGQNCKAKLYSLIGEEHEEMPSSEVEEVVEFMEQLLAQQETPGEISINALSGSKSIGTIRFQGVLKGRRVSILIDSGSTHSFIDSRMVKQLGLVAEIVPPLIISVADGSRIIVDSLCKHVKYIIQGINFIVS